ncbi:MAG: hypothetical protein PUI38_01170 [Candidatus Treponema excrementipullorum]|nr:hypothetical protein [Spirochaetia bacterium]MDD7011451.1 hypothetical protein [Candidatus Treponema excrementipullorum]MDY4708096.1 hypothetical protein [Candidatus Treponema excrementipullorum]
MDNTFFDNDTFEVHKNQTEFDKYGVWVKKPPRSLEENTSLDEKQEESVADTILQDTQVETPQDEISQTPNAEPLEELSPIDEAIISLPEMTTETETNDSVLPKVTETQAEGQTETVLHQDITLDPLPQQEQQQDGEVTKNIQETIVSPKKEDVSDPDIFTELPPEFEEEELTYDFENTPTTSFTDAEGLVIQEMQEGNTETAHEASVENTFNSSIDFDDISEISLDDFIDEPETEKNDIQDAPIIDMDLSFDENYTESNEDAQEEKEDEPEIPEEDGVTVTADNFDEMFDNLVDESSETAIPESVREENTIFDNNQDTDIQDFDKFLEDFSDNSVGISTEEHSSAPVQKDYSMEVTFDDETGDSVEETSFISSTKEEEEVVPLDQNSDQEKTEVFKVPTLEGIETSEYTEKDRSGADDFDIDKVLSEVEDVTTGNISGLMSVTETGNLNDTEPQAPNDVTETYQNEAEEMENSKAQEQIKLLTEEIAELRREFSALKTEFEAFKNKASAINQSPVSETSDGSGGFFDDGADDDNTIALSGDELTNILNTADFTEEHTEDHISEDFDEDETVNELESPSQLPEEIEIPKNGDDADENKSEEISVNQDLNFQQETEETFVDGVTEQDFEEPFVPPFEEEELPSTDDELREVMEEAYPDKEGVVSEDITEPLDFEDQESEELDDMFQTPQWNTEVAEEDGTLSSFFNEDNGFMVSEEPVFQETVEEKTEEDFTVPTPVTELAEESVLEAVQEDTQKPVEEDVLEAEEAEPVEDVFQTDQWTTLEAPMAQEGFIAESEPVAEEIVKEDAEEDFVIPVQSSEFADEPASREMQEYDEEVISSEENTVSKSDEEVGAAEEKTEESLFEEPHEDAREPSEEELTGIVEAEPVETISSADQWTAEVSSGTETEASAENEEVDRSFVIEETPDIITEEETEHLQELEEEPVEPILAESYGFETPDVKEDVSSENESVPQSEEVAVENQISEIPQDLKQDIKSVLVYMDQLLDSLPEEKIAEFARSEHFELYKKLFNELGLS